MTRFFVGAYAAAPSLTGWNPSAEGRFLKSVAELEGVAGLEVPFTGALHKDDEAWFLRQLPEQADFVVTTIPGTMARLSSDPCFGLASTSTAGRRAAIDFIRDALKAVGRLNERVGRSAVVALEIHSAPWADGQHASTAALSDSLTEISQWEWNGAQLALEHCDAFVLGQAPAKGFLSLEEEAVTVRRVIESTGRPMGIAINWGRSVLEQRRPEAALEHINFLREGDLLGGFVLSGCAGVDTRYGAAWADVHVPPAPRTERHAGPSVESAADLDVLEASSLLTVERMEECLRAAGPGTGKNFRGIKVAAPPHATVEQRVAVISKTLDLAIYAATQDWPSRTAP
ncbi:DUF4862 family protein [Arthrobacter sp. FW306-04-A]|uniref:DUF4862 family protein n=1 Tax=Arthrobacter sp. FW306-04-A TaxID=2879619 RepID=UPI0037BF811F|nr:DUF4862 family protein [Arthrobacter sp. FW306-04-A]